VRVTGPITAWFFNRRAPFVKGLTNFSIAVHFQFLHGKGGPSVEGEIAQKAEKTVVSDQVRQFR
jgi:hypothetical protein